MQRDARLLVVALALVCAPVALVFPGAVASGALAIGALAFTFRRPGEGGPRTVVVGAMVFALSLGRAMVGSTQAENERIAAARALPHPCICTGEGTVRSVAALGRGELGSAEAERIVIQVASVTCDGVAASLPRVLLHLGADATAASAVSTSADGLVRGDFVRGDTVVFTARLARPERFWNGPESDPRPREARTGIVATGSALAVSLGPARGRGPLAWIDGARRFVRRRIHATFAGPAIPLARALVLGETVLDETDESAFRNSGLLHLLAVSGAHLSLVVVTLERALRASLSRVPALAARVDVGRLAGALLLPAPFAYADFAGGSGSAWRAAVMAAVMLAARALGRHGSALRALAWSILLLGLVDPFVAFDVSFQLSCAATFGLLLFARPLEAALLPRGAGAETGVPWRRPFAFARRAIAPTLAATLAATLACAPLLATLSPTLPLAGALANVVAVPLGELAALPLCLAHAALAWAPPVERGCAVVASGALVALRAVARVFGGDGLGAVSPGIVSLGAVPVPPPTAGQRAIAITVLTALVWGWPRRPKERRAALGIALAGVLVLEMRARLEGAPRGQLRVTFLDVGQGDAALVDLPDGSAILVDGGGLVGSPLDVGTRVIAPLLRARRRSALRAVILTHPHPDHAGGLLHGVDGVTPHAFWDTGQGEAEGAGGVYAAVLARMRARGVPVLGPAELCKGAADGAKGGGPPADLGGAHVEVLAPCPAFDPLRSANDNSFVLRIRHGAHRFLFVGDAEGAEEEVLLRQTGQGLAADVLKVGHHGSRTSSSEAFVAAVRPSLAIVSTGVRNRFGHPHLAPLATLRAAGARVLRTDQHGAIVLRSDGRTLWLTDAWRTTAVHSFEAHSPAAHSPEGEPALNGAP